MISAFGPRATRYMHGLGDLDAVVTDVDTIGEAYLEAVKRRQTGEPFYGMVLVDDSRIAFGYRHVAEILDQVPDYDRRRVTMDQLLLGALPINGARVDTLWHLDGVMQAIITEFLALCDAVLVRSFSEVARINSWFRTVEPRRPLPPVARILAAANVPKVERVRPVRPGVIVWAPERPALETALHLHGLAEFHGDVTCVSAGGSQPSRTSATFLEPAEPGVAAALSRASAIVCTDPCDPSAAVAFARLGYGVVAPTTSGAHEFAGDVVTWDALDARFLFTAVAVAVARPASVRSEPARPARAPRRPAPPAFVKENEWPLVSIITPVYNRREDLLKMLSCLAAQTYPNIESVVVNDGGDAVEDVVAEFPFTRLVDRPANAGAIRAVEVGRREARGEYIGLLADDDRFYPDHVERLMIAMVRSGTKVAHGTALLRYLERAAGGELETVGFNNRAFAETLAPSEALVKATLRGQQMLVHRSVYDEAGGYLLDSDIADNEIHIRFTQRYFYAFVDHVTSELCDHDGGQERRRDVPAALREVYEKHHPVPDRPLIARIRQATIEKLQHRPAGKPSMLPSLVLLKPSNST